MRPSRIWSTVLVHALVLVELTILHTGQCLRLDGTLEVQDERGPELDYGYSRIVGGQVAQEGRYNYLVNVGKGRAIFCGGSLIAPRVVLTAAHCPDADRVWFGKHNVMEAGLDRVYVKQLLRHPGYVEKTSSNDIMLLLLEREPEGGIEPIRLMDPQKWSDIVETLPELTAMGWGATTDGGGMVHTLHDTEVKMWELSMCKRRYPRQLDKTMFCAVNPGKDTCQGDSGGPLVLKGLAFDGSQDLQAGIVSWGYGCAQSYFPGVYTSIDYFRGWIDDQLRGWEQTRPGMKPSSSPSAPAASQIAPAPGPKPKPQPKPPQASALQTGTGALPMTCQKVSSSYTGGASGGMKVTCSNTCSFVSIDLGADGAARAYCHRASQ